jgi:AraC-like DNA-binding protein
MRTLRFSSGDLPPSLDEAGKYKAWLNFYANFYTEIAMQRAEGRPFNVRFEAAQIGDYRVGRIEGSFSQITRTAEAVAAARNDDLLIAMNTASARLFYSQAGRDVTLEPGSAVLCTNAEPGIVHAEDLVGWMFVGFPPKEFSALQPGIADLVGRAFDPRNPGLRQLDRYVAMLLSADETPDDLALTEHIESSLRDLVTIACDMEQEMSRITRMGAVRGAQFRAVVNEIRASYDRPEFSPGHVCKKLKMSPRYLQTLLAESGAGFSERVMELRLRKARGLLERPSGQPAKIGEIAYLSGFSDVSYFNRRFRRRFGKAPGELRVKRA